MSLGRIMGVILSVLAVSFFINNEIGNGQIDKNTIEINGSVAQVEENNINYDTISLTDKNNSNTEIIRYTNNQPYSIDIKASDVAIDCEGTSSVDVNLVKKNMSIKAYFSRINDMEKTTSIKIKSKETINIYIVNEYVGQDYPKTEVICKYNINIKDF